MYRFRASKKKAQSCFKKITSNLVNVCHQINQNSVMQQGNPLICQTKVRSFAEEMYNSRIEEKAFYVKFVNKAFSSEWNMSKSDFKPSKHYLFSPFGDRLNQDLKD